MKQVSRQQLLAHIKRTVSQVLLDTNHELFHDAVVTEVSLNNDGSTARIWVTATPAQLKELNGRYRREIHIQFMKQYSRKVVPKLIFISENGELNKIDELLENL